MAQSIKTELESVMDKTNIKSDTQLKVIQAMDDFIKSDKVSWQNVEAVKNLYDHYNPDGIKW